MHLGVFLQEVHGAFQELLLVDGLVGRVGVLCAEAEVSLDIVLQAWVAKEDLVLEVLD